MIRATIVDTKARHAVSRQFTVPSTAMLLTTAAAGGIVVQARRFSMLNAALPAATIRPARAPGKRSAKKRAMTRQMLEQVDTKVAADLDEGAGGHPAGHRHRRWSPAVTPTRR